MSARMLLSATAGKGLHLHQMDTITAFFSGYLNEQVLREQVLGYEQGDPAECVSCLKKVFYGLNLTFQHWYAKIDKFYMMILAWLEAQQMIVLIWSKRQPAS